MPKVARFIRGAVNRLLRPAGAELAPLWRRDHFENELRGNVLGFDFRGIHVPFFLHHFNCGGHPCFATERTVELAIADRWLAQRTRGNVIEIGAVTPYYWPHRVQMIVDPFDSHELVSDRRGVDDISLCSRDVLSISTYEHIGTGDYGLSTNEDLLNRAFTQLFDTACNFLVTIPLGYNPAADALVLSSRVPVDVSVGVIARCGEAPYWHEVPAQSGSQWRYGSGRANAVAILERSRSQLG